MSRPEPTGLRLQSTLPVKHVLQLAFALFATTVAAQQQRLTVVIDPARGGTEYGARLDAHTYEKQVTLDLANRLRSLLAARDFDVVLTRDSDTLVTNDQRAAIANQAKPIACLLLHSTGSGTGLHLFTSSLQPSAATATGVPWDEAQAPFVQRSERLQNDLATAFSRSKLSVSTGHTWIRPLDNMQCPAIAIEVAPESSSTDAADRVYQTRIADAIASSMLAWRTHTDVVQSIVAPAPPVAPAKPASTTGTDDGVTKAPATKTTPSTSAAPGTPKTTTDAAKPAIRKAAAPVQPAPSTTAPEGGSPQ